VAAGRWATSSPCCLLPVDTNHVYSMEPRPREVKARGPPQSRGGRAPHNCLSLRSFAPRQNRLWQNMNIWFQLTHFDE
jgi:hypothetical protein